MRLPCGTHFVHYFMLRLYGVISGVGRNFQWEEGLIGYIKPDFNFYAFTYGAIAQCAEQRFSLL